MSWAHFRKKLPLIFRTILLAAVSVYIAAAAHLYFNQASYVYHPTKEWTATPEKIGLEYEDVTFSAADGTRLSGWYIPAKDSRGTLLFCHGNANNISYELSPMAMYHKLGFTLFFFDYRGYGHSEGAPSQKGVQLDAQAALDFLLSEKEIRLDQIILLGRSFGGSVAIPLAAKHAFRALIVEASFTSLADIGAKMHPFFPVRQLLRDPYNSIAFLPAVKSPVLVVHSRDDQLIPYEQGRRLYEAVPEPKQFLEITGPHDNRNDPASQAMYRRGIADYLDWLDKR